MNDTVGQRGLAVINMGDDGKIADVIQDVMPCRNRRFYEARILADFGRQSGRSLLVLKLYGHPRSAIFPLDQKRNIAPLGHLLEEIVELCNAAQRNISNRQQNVALA